MASQLLPQPDWTTKKQRQQQKRQLANALKRAQAAAAGASIPPVTEQPGPDANQTKAKRPRRSRAKQKPTQDQDSDVEPGATIERVVASGAAGAEAQKGVYNDEAETASVPDKQLNHVAAISLPKVPDGHDRFVPLQQQYHKREFDIPGLPHCNDIDEEPPAGCANHCRSDGNSELCANCKEAGELFGSDYSMPLRLTKLFLPDEALDIIVCNTNDYAEAKGALTEAAQRRDTPWRPLTRAELKIWLGLLTYMSVIRISRIDEYWSTSAEMPYHGSTAFMSWNRFQSIKRYLHVAPLGDVPPERWWTKLEPLSSMVKVCCCQ